MGDCIVIKTAGADANNQESLTEQSLLMDYVSMIAARYIYLLPSEMPCRKKKIGQSSLALGKQADSGSG